MNRSPQELIGRILGESKSYYKELVAGPGTITPPTGTKIVITSINVSNDRTTAPTITFDSSDAGDTDHVIAVSKSSGVGDWKQLNVSGVPLMVFSVDAVITITGTGAGGAAIHCIVGYYEV